MNINLKVYSFLVSSGVLKKNDINPKQNNTMLNGEEDVGEALKNSCIKVVEIQVSGLLIRVIKKAFLIINKCQFCIISNHEKQHFTAKHYTCLMV